MNTSFGIEFDDDMICAVEKLEKDYVLKEVNSYDSGTVATPGPNQDVQCHRKEKFSRRKVGATPSDSGRRRSRTFDVDDKCTRSNSAEDAMSLTVVKGHDGDKVVLSTRDEASDQDVMCTWNSPLLVSTPVVVLSKRRLTNTNTAKSVDANGAAAAAQSAVTVTPKQLNSARKPKTKKIEKTKLFGAALNVSSPTDSATVPNRPQSSHCSGRQDCLSNERENSTSAISDPDGMSWLTVLHFTMSYCTTSY